MAEDEPGLTIPAERMRALGYRAVELIVEHLTGLGEKTVARRRWRADLADVLGEPLPWSAGDPHQVLEEVGALLSESNAHPDHTKFLAFVPCPSNYIATLAAALAAGFVVPTSSWFTGPASTAVELITVRWLAELLGLPLSAGGLFVSGGSAANFTALAVAREVTLGKRVDDGVAYCSDETHLSVRRALRLLGIAEERVRWLPSGADHRLDPLQVMELVAEDRRRKLRPFVVIANAGTTSTGAIDPLPELADLCREERLWLHVDGAYGAPAALTTHGRQRLAGMDQADSLTVDPHKWLFQPAELGCVLLRDPKLLRHTFGVARPGYLSGLPEHDGVDLMQFGLQQTREFRALKLWMTLKVFGAEAIAAAIERGIRQVEQLGQLISECPELELVTQPSLGIVTFRALLPGKLDHSAAAEKLTDHISLALLESGHALVMPVVVNGRRVLRICAINPRMRDGELTEVLIHIRRIIADYRADHSQI